MSDGWEAFVASLDPGEVERERMRVLGDLRAERPGSRQDREMRQAHEWLTEWWRLMRDDPSERRARRERIRQDQEAWVDEQVAERQARFRERRYRVNEDPQELAAYAARQKQRRAAAAAERGTAA